MTGSVLYDGPSLIDGEPIAAIVTGIGRPSKNQKTGVMSQCWFIRSDIDPFSALHCGADESVCGDCPMRGTTESGTCRERVCYVNVAKCVSNVFGALKRRSYDTPVAVASAVADYRPTRLGAYGEPTAAPIEALLPIIGKAGRTGYTHRWRECDPEWRGYIMASVDTPAARVEARNAGWRTFRMRLASEPLVRGEIACPASSEGGAKRTCADCLLCKGGRGPGVAIIAHGQGARAYERWRAANG
jgi:hypothetical protein